MTIPFAKTKASATLDLLRGLAAVLVCLGHWRNVLFVDYDQRSVRGVAAAVFYLVTSCGHQSVVIFFVLSGYLIGGSVRRSVARGEWSWRQYGLQRLTRLWVVLVPGLVLCAVWDWVGMRSGWAPRLYGGLSGDHMVPDVAAAYRWAAFGRTLFFLQGITGRVFGSDGPLWSLGYEAWYYCMFPLGLFAVMPGVRARVRVVCAVMLVGVAGVQGREMLGMFPIWLAGVALLYLPACRARGWVRCVAVMVWVPVFLGAGRFVRVLGGVGWMSDYVVGAATVALLWVLLSARQEQTGAGWERVGRGVARCSFTLYVVHTPLLVVLAAWAARDQRWQPDWRHLLVGSGVLGVVIGCAWVVAWGTEFRTDGVRRWVERRVIR